MATTMRKGASFAAYRQFRSLQGLHNPIRTSIVSHGQQILAPKSIISSFTARRPLATNNTATRRHPSSKAPTVRTTTTSNLQELKERIQNWINVPVGQWASREIAQGHNLIDQCLNNGTTQGIQWATRMLQRWIEERHSQNQLVEGRQLVELLHRVLHGWRHCPERAEAAQTALQLVESLEQACKSGRAVPESHFPGNKAYSMVFQLLALQPSHPDTLEIARNLLERRIKTSETDLMLWRSCLHAMAKCSPHHPNAAEMAEQTLQRMVTIQPDVVCFANVLHAWARSGREGAAQRAQDILDTMLSPNSPVEPNSVCVNTCIDAWAKSGDPCGAQYAQDLLIRMEDVSRTCGKDVSLDFIAYNTVIHGWARSPDPRAPEYAEDIFNRMLRISESGNERIQPDEWTCASVMDSWAKSGRPEASKRAQAMLRRMEELHMQGRLSIQRPSPMYASVVYALATSHDQAATKKAERLLKQVEDWNKAETGLYNATIHIWSKSPQKDSPRRALSILRRMQRLQKEGRENVDPNVITYNGVIAACASQGDAKLANELLEEMQYRSVTGEPNVEPDSFTYASVIAACGKAKLRDRAMQLLDEVETEYKDGNDLVKPTTMAYMAAISAWENCGDSNAGDRAEDILWRMMESYENGNADAKPNAATVAAVMRVWLSSREAQAPEKIEALFNWMDEHSKAGDEAMIPKAIHYKYLIDTWARSRRFHSVGRIESILDDMWQDPNESVHPNRDVYNTLLRSIRHSFRQGRATKSLDVLKEMIHLYRQGNDAMKPSRATFHSVLLSCSGLEESDQGEQEAAATALRVVFQAFASSNEWEPPNASTFELLKTVTNDLGDTVDKDLAMEIHRYVQESGVARLDTPKKEEHDVGPYFWHSAS